jgi:hypothetical protein
MKDIRNLPDRNSWDDQLETSHPSWDTSDIEAQDPIKSTQQTTELACRLYEENRAASKKYRMPNQDVFTSDEERIGHILHYQPFIQRLKKILPARYNDFSRRGMVGLNLLVPTIKGGHWMYPCAVQVGYMPEYSVMHVDRHDVATNEKYRGWRGTVLLRLITDTYCPQCCTNGQCLHPDALRCGYISEEAAHKEFGEPDLYNSSLYRQALQYFRNHR